MEQSFPLEIFRKRRNNFRRILLFLFYQNDRNITEPFASSHLRTMLLGEIRGLFPKIIGGENRSISFTSGTTVFCIQMEDARELYCSIWRKILSGFSIQIESAPGFHVFARLAPVA